MIIQKKFVFLHSIICILVMRKFIIRTLWTILVTVVLVVALAFYAISEGWIGYMPPIEDLQNPISPLLHRFCLLTAK